MKKLFNIGSQIVVDEFSSLRITGPYELVTLGPDFAIIKCDDYVIEVSGDQLTVEKLAEELAVFTFDSIERFSLVESNGEEGSYGA
ncbi:hypothetical protein [Sporosarcina pasteurii]|uniref:Uncharacterized protein n=1 Tax=Sporosarcina pasteurii TaxID=1474 RepID=A0A380BNU0_SPOPA|nr:hypothetical protein [Sporosarcina pasteurii]MDS9471027.1 hypothetical protein [Sporosarcina pasteurii]QBQ05326.1 hypothetical protein E2C16_06405 [Sporosarcina pasteurii]SUJ04035.1 Uncharacterised protein [Sporosarcina pasteurii]